MNEDLEENGGLPEPQAVSAARIRTVPILPAVLMPAGSSMLSNCIIRTDNGGNSFLIYAVSEGNSTWVKLHKVNSAGAVVATKEMEASANPTPFNPTKKIEALDAIINGKDVVVFLCAYELTSPNRSHSPEVGIWKDIAVPYPTGVNPFSGGPASFRPDGSIPNPEPGGDMDEATFKKWVREVLGIGKDSTLAKDWGAGLQGGSADKYDWRGVIEDKDKHAMVELSDPANYSKPEHPLSKAYQDMTFAMDDRRMYFGLNKHIIGGNTALPVENEAYIALLKRVINEALDEREG